MPQVREIEAADVAPLDPFELFPQALARIEFGGIRWQALQVHPLGLAIRSPHIRKEPTVMRPILKSFVAVVLVGCFAVAVAVAGEQECNGPYKGFRLKPEELTDPATKS
jgi:hypothetical protein